ncbi:MAG: FAD-dependent oxidoreductase, partial [Pseudomonadota bacterium]
AEVHIHRLKRAAVPRGADQMAARDVVQKRAEPRVRFAGQVTGVEGYVESAAMGLLAGRFAAADLLGETATPPPATTALGALLNHITGGHLVGAARDSGTFQPMNVNFGLFPEIETPRVVDGRRLRGKERGRARKQALSARALVDVEAWLTGGRGERVPVAAE